MGHDRIYKDIKNSTRIADAVFSFYITALIAALRLNPKILAEPVPEDF